MLAATATHVRRGKLANVPANAILLASAVFIAIERFGPHAR